MIGKPTVIRTIATGPYAEMSDISGLRCDRFARHLVYELIVTHHRFGGERRLAWSTLPLSSQAVRVTLMRRTAAR